MSRRRDPIQRREDGDIQLHDIVEWEPKTVLDQVIYYTYSLGIRVFIVSFAAILLCWQLALKGGDALATDPFTLTFIALSAVPALALAAFVWYADVTSTPSPRVIAVSFLLGMAFVSIAGLLNPWLGNALISAFSHYDIWQAVAASVLFFVVIAPVEESLKLLAVQFYAYRTTEFESVLSGAVFGAAAGLGFATMENAFYITQVIGESGSLSSTGTQGRTIATVRALVGPGHVIYSAFTGYYLGLARFNRRYAGPVVLKGLSIAILLHAGYNVLVSEQALHLPGYLVDVAGLSEFAAVFTFVVAYNGILTILLVYKLSKYRTVYRKTHDDETIQSELTEFEP